MISMSSINSHIIETNASGIVTIVIDEDIHESNDDINDEDSNYEYSPTPLATRPAIGVRTPIPTPGSPKFINSENCQNLLIKENNSNVIVVNSGRSTQTSFRSGHTSLSPTSSCCSSQSIPTELKTHHNIISKTQTHYVMINKPKPSVSSTTASSMASNPSSTECTIKCSPTKLRLWTQPSSLSTPRSPQVIISTRTRSHTTLPPEDVESDCMDDQTFFKYLNLIPVQNFKTKSVTDWMSVWPLRKINKIPKLEYDFNKDLVLTNFKILRDPIRSVPNLGPALTERKLRWYREATHYNERLQKFKANLPINSEIRERTQRDLERLHKRLMNEKQRYTVEEEKFRRLKSQEENQRLQREELKQELDNYINDFDISSIMGRRIRNLVEDSYMTPLLIFKNIEFKIEAFANHRDILLVSAPQNTKLSTRITRSTTGFAGIDRMWGPRNESHQYSFTRRQRLNRYHRLDTGLNWKSRLVKKHCRRIDVEVAKITRCPCCLEVVEPEWGHSCRDSDEESIPEVSSINDSDFCIQSESNFNEEEVNSTNSEITARDVIRCECGQYDCDCECVGTTPVSTQATNKASLVEDSFKTWKFDRIIVFSASEELLPFKHEIEDKVMIQKVAVLHDKSDNKNNIINSNNIDRKSDLIKQNLRSNDNSNASNNDIVVISQVSADSPPNQQKRMSEPDIVERFFTPNTNKNVSNKRKFNEKRLRSHSRNNSDEIIIKKLK